MKSKADIFEQAIRDFGIEATLEYFDVPLLKKQDFRNQWKESESPSPLSGEEIKPFDSAGARVHFLLNLKKAQLMEYIYDFAWHYGRLYHIGDAETIKEAIKEKFQLPEEFLYELLNRDQDAQASVATDSNSSTSDDTKNNSSNSGEQQPVTGDRCNHSWVKYKQCCYCGAFDNSREIIEKRTQVNVEKIRQDFSDWYFGIKSEGYSPLAMQIFHWFEKHIGFFEHLTASRPPTPEPAGELYRLVKASERKPERSGEYFVYVDDYKSVSMFVDDCFWSDDNKLTVNEWLEKVEPQQNQDEAIFFNQKR